MKDDNGSNKVEKCVSHVHTRNYLMIIKRYHSDNCCLIQF